MNDQSDDHEHGNCEETLVELYTFLDGEMNVEQRVRIQHHLDDCGDCLEAFDFEAELRLVIAQKCQDPCPDQLRERIAQALHAASSATPSGDGGDD